MYSQSRYVAIRYAYEKRTNDAKSVPGNRLPAAGTAARKLLKDYMKTFKESNMKELGGIGRKNYEMLAGYFGLALIIALFASCKKQIDSNQTTGIAIQIPGSKSIQASNYDYEVFFGRYCKS